MRKLIIKLLGLEDFRSAVDFSLELLRKENEELTRKVQALTEQVEEMEEPDLSDYVQECDIDDKIDQWLDGSDYVTKYNVDDLIEEAFNDKEEDFTEAVKNNLEEEIGKLVQEAVKKAVEATKKPKKKAKK